MMSKLIDWIHDYIDRHEYSEYFNKRLHVIFYAVCRAFFHLFIIRHKELVRSVKGKRRFFSIVNIHIRNIYVDRIIS